MIASSGRHWRRPHCSRRLPGSGAAAGRVVAERRRGRARRRTGRACRHRCRPAPRRGARHRAGAGRRCRDAARGRPQAIWRRCPSGAPGWRPGRGRFQHRARRTSSGSGVSSRRTAASLPGRGRGDRASSAVGTGVGQHVTEQNRRPGRRRSRHGRDSDGGHLERDHVGRPRPWRADSRTIGAWPSWTAAAARCRPRRAGTRQVWTRKVRSTGGASKLMRQRDRPRNRRRSRADHQIDDMVAVRADRPCQKVETAGAAGLFSAGMGAEQRFVARRAAFRGADGARQPAPPPPPPAGGQDRRAGSLRACRGREQRRAAAQSRSSHSDTHRRAAPRPKRTPAGFDLAQPVDGDAKPPSAPAALTQSRDRRAAGVRRSPHPRATR